MALYYRHGIRRAPIPHYRCRVIIPCRGTWHSCFSILLLTNRISSSSVLSTINNLQWYHDVVIRPRAQTMPVQAIVNILIQKLPHLAVLPPGDAPPWFRSSLTTVDKGDRKGYQVTLDVRSTNSPAPFQLTNSRLLHALSHLGLFDQQGEQAWYEFDFDIRMSKVTAWPAFTDTTIIATGNITNMGLTSTSWEAKLFAMMLHRYSASCFTGTVSGRNLIQLGVHPHHERA